MGVPFWVLSNNILVLLGGLASPCQPIMLLFNHCLLV